MPTFTPPIDPSVSSSFKVTPQVYKASFADGREQVVAKGINNIDRSVTLTFQALTDAELQSLNTFFDGRAGVESFDYQIPGEASSKTWREESGTRSYNNNGGLWSLSVGIREVRL